ncbi:PREDICTED: SET domain-containing protein 9 isoform X1 [Nanorana parkeri]|uniref:SET domain-containing protein 9 isoform X1 n=1 Tax=Nanorana parkeri TaxID=125878 RepID=UPI0008542494|nr:PREDICTED: SET domain-containing protein 9 isoform X1 [Nanorana parkeri]
MSFPGSVVRALLTRWKSYRHRFVPWVALNLARNRRTLRYVSEGSSDKLIPDADVKSALVGLFQAFFMSDLYRQRDLLHMLPECTKALYYNPDIGEAPSCHTEQDVTLQAAEIMHRSFGFTIERQPSSLDSAGIGVFVCRGFVPKGAIVSMYPGAIYQKYEPIFFQSVGNPFIFRCLDGILIDGNDKGISKSVYRSCNGRDQLGPLKMCDSTWLTSFPRNPLAVGQYVNNCSNEKEANVCYQEFDVPDTFPVELRQYIPNIHYSHESEGPIRCVVLVALRDIHCGEELFSNYFTIVR